MQQVLAWNWFKNRYIEKKFFKNTKKIFFLYSQFDSLFFVLFLSLSAPEFRDATNGTGLVFLNFKAV